MELVEGEDLAQRIARGAIPVDEALPIARQIADALEAAHEQGIIHRDLKPANIKVRPEGTVKVLDFGLAKALAPEPVSGAAVHLSQSPTITSPAMSQAGLILGTAAYMSPEQAKGRPVDRRADVWAFGAVLYEMLTGQRAFAGEDVSDTLANVLKSEPDWERLPADVAARIRQVLRACLQKSSKQRIGDVQDVRLALEGAFDTAAAPTSAPGVMIQPAGWRRVATLTASAVVIGAIVAATVVWIFIHPAEPVPPRVSRLQVPPSGTAALTITGTVRDLAITPDGSRLIYVGNRGRQIFVRALDVLEPVAVFTGVPRGPFVSPDGQWIGFADGATLKRVAVSGGPAVPMTTIDGPTSLGATWGPDDTIIFGTTNGATGLQQVSAAAGPTTVLTRADVEQGEADHAWPEWLPGGRAVLFTIMAVTGGLDAAQVAVLDLQTGTRRVLVRGGSHAHYVRSGHLVYATAATLRAVAFDLARLETRGTPVAVVADVVTTVNGAVNAVVANDGTLAYVSGGVVAQAPRTLVWVDRHGSETPIPSPPRVYAHPRLSPDGKRVAVFAADQELDLWLFDLARPTLTRVTSGPGVDAFPVWTPDGHRLIFSSQRSSAGNLFSYAADGTGAVERLTESPNVQNATAISPDGSSLTIEHLDGYLELLNGRAPVPRDAMATIAAGTKAAGVWNVPTMAVMAANVGVLDTRELINSSTRTRVHRQRVHRPMACATRQGWNPPARLRDHPEQPTASPEGAERCGSTHSPVKSRIGWHESATHPGTTADLVETRVAPHDCRTAGGATDMSRRHSAGARPSSFYGAGIRQSAKASVLIAMPKKPPTCGSPGSGPIPGINVTPPTALKKKVASIPTRTDTFSPVSLPQEPAAHGPPTGEALRPSTKYRPAMNASAPTLTPKMDTFAPNTTLTPLSPPTATGP
jgi:serine/threonine-protein kinase